MLIHELTRAECEQVLQSSSVGHLACSNGEQPYVVPIHIAFDSEKQCVYGVSLVGQKVSWMRANPKVCLVTDDVVDKNRWRTVVLTGTYEELKGAVDGDEAERRCLALFRRREEWWFPAMAHKRSDRDRGVLLFRILIRQMTGRRADRSDIVAPTL